jgi:hypothetical protein
LGRPSAREDAYHQDKPEFPLGNPREISGTQRERRDHAAAAVSNNRVNEA